MKIYVSCKISAELKTRLEKYGDVILLPCFSRLDVPVSCHADMLIFHSDATGKTFVSDEYYNENKALFDGVDITTVGDSFSPVYPNDILLDACKMGKYLFCKEKYTSGEIKEGYTVVNVNQGYAGCSVLRVNERAMITADEGICRRAESLGIEVLKISSGNILLEGYSFGFIGGASFVSGDDVLFFGDVRLHPDFERIRDFLLKYRKNIIYIKDMPLTDFGSAVCVEGV